MTMQNVLEIDPLIAQAGKPLLDSDVLLPQFDSGKHRRFSAAVLALIAYALCWLIGGWLYSRYSERAAHILPAKCDVLMAGSSVINTPLMHLEFPGRDRSLYAEQHPLVEPRRLEWFLSNYGAHLTVFSGATMGQSIEETEDFVHDVTSLNKHPRVLMLFLAPIIIRGGHDPTYCGLLPPAVLNSFQLAQRRFEEFHFRVAVEVKGLQYLVYGKTALPEPLSVRWQRVERDYKLFYESPLNTHKLESLRRIANMCSEHSIPVIVVSTPLAPSNRAVLSTFSYADYHQALQQLLNPAKGESGASRNVRFVDLGTDARFLEAEDFDDGSHLNAKGGKKMFSILAPTIMDTVNSVSGEHKTRAL